MPAQLPEQTEGLPDFESLQKMEEKRKTQENIPEKMFDVVLKEKNDDGANIYFEGDECIPTFITSASGVSWCNYVVYDKELDSLVTIPSDNVLYVNQKYGAKKSIEEVKQYFKRVNEDEKTRYEENQKRMNTSPDVA